jgi:hypothetical protein
MVRNKILSSGPKALPPDLGLRDYRRMRLLLPTRQRTATAINHFKCLRIKAKESYIGLTQDRATLARHELTHRLR